MISYDQVTIIIPHFGAEKEQCYALSECLKSLEETVPEIKILVVKNGPACQCRRDIRIIEQGQCKAVNAAVAITNTPWIFVTNDDMIYAPGWWEKLIEPLGQRYLVNKNTSLEQIDFRPGGTVFVENVDAVRELPEIMCISPMLIEPRPGAPTFEVFFAGGAGGDFDKKKWLSFAHTHNDTPHDPTIRTGFNLPFLIKRELWDTIGGYDINYDPWGSNSDSDLEYKIKLVGIQPYQNTRSAVYHFSQTSGTFHPDNNSYWHKNFAYFEEKWGFPRTDNGIWEANFEIPNEGRKFRPEWEGKYK